MVARLRARFRCYAELNDFLPAARRQREFEASFVADASLKHIIEALGVPHTEVDLILRNGNAATFEERLAEGDRVSIYPVFEALDIGPLQRLRAAPLRESRFIADAHLGGLARLLRMAGFDTLYRNDYADDEVLALALTEQRILLTRDRELLKRRELQRACYVHALKPIAQLEEVLARLDLGAAMAPLSRCLACNLPLTPIAREAVAHRLPEGVRERHQHFAGCRHCGSVLWEGSHFRRMQMLMAALRANLARAPRQV